MPKFCANLTWLFTDLPFIERIAAAREAGFHAVEVLFPYDANAQDIVNELGRYEMTMALINSPPPNYTGGEPGWAAVPGLEERFRGDFRRGHRYARTLHAKHLHVMAGDAEGDEAGALFIENLRWAAAEAPDIAVHVQVAQTPDRSEPGKGQIDYPAFFAALDASGYDGWVSGEYKPKAETKDGLGWMI